MENRMPGTGAHKAKTRVRILKAAGRLFRRDGFNGVGIDKVMAEAGLTRGGFYAHFASKEDLLRAVVSEVVFAGLIRMHERGGMDDPPNWLAAAIDGYLSEDHRDRTMTGISDCPIAALSAEVSRAGPEVRSAYTEVARDLMSALAGRIEPRLAECAPDAGGPADFDAWERAIVLVALLSGGLVLSRAVNDKALSAAVLEAARKGAKLVAKA